MVALAPVEWRPGLALAATELPAGESRTLELALQPNVNYAFIATTNDEANDIDLYLLDSLGNILAQDQDADGTPILEFQVLQTGNYRVQVQSASATPRCFIALSLLQSSGASIIENAYRLQSNRFFTATTTLREATPSLDWHNTPKTWPILGFLAARDIPLELTQLHLPPKRYQIAASTNPSIRNLSLYLADSKGDIVANTKTKSPFPLLQFQSNTEHAYDLLIVPKGSKYFELLFLGIFQH